jgi:hypothetical protein
LVKVVETASDRTSGEVVAFLDWYERDGYTPRAEAVDRQELLDALASSD